MNNRLLKAIVMFALLLLNVSAVLADRREIEFPILDGYFSGHPDALAFSTDGKIGFAIASNLEDGSNHLFSFSVAERKIIDEFNLTEDFGAGFPTVFMKAQVRAHLIAFYGITMPGRAQRVVSVGYNEAGKLSKQWARSYTSTNGLWPELAFNEDGSRIYTVYTDQLEGVPSENEFSAQNAVDNPSVKPLVAAVQRVDLIRAEDGAVLATANLSEVGHFVSVVFDDVHDRAIAFAGTSAHVFAPGNDNLQIESTIGPVTELVDLTSPVISNDGRFVIAYAGFAPDGGDAGINNFVSYDLELKVAHPFSVKDKFFPGSNLLTFHRPTNTLLVPLSAWLREESDGSLTLSFTSSRQGHIITVGSDGSLRQRPDVMLPKRSPGGVGRNVIGPFNNMTISPTGALGFVSTHSSRLISFDTLTGEIVNDKALISENRTYIHYASEIGMLVYSSGNKLVLEDVDLGPVITSIDVSKNQTSISGANFLFGAYVTINGKDLGVADRNPGDPGREIILQRGKKDFPAGENFTVVITNRDGLSSKPFTLRR